MLLYIKRGRIFAQPLKISLCGDLLYGIHTRVQIPATCPKTSNASIELEPLKIAFERLQTCMVTGQNSPASKLIINYGGGGPDHFLATF
jgi:hypothetical protein